MLRLVLSAGVFLLATAAPARQDKPKDDPKDPTYDGKKASEWVDTLANGTSARQRALAVEALAKLWSERQYLDALPSIGRALRLDSSAAVRTRAALAFGGLREADVGYLIKEKESRGIKDLIDSLGTEKESRVRKEIARSIARFPAVAKMAVAQLTDALKDPEPATRAAVAEAVGVAGTEAKSAAVNLAPLLADTDKAVRLAAVVAFGRITPEGSPAIAERMAKMLATEKDVDMRGELIISLRLLNEKSPAVVSALAAALDDPEDELRRRAARTLGLFGTAAAPAADALLKVARADSAKDIRVDAVRGFGSALGPDGLKPRIKDLLALLSDRDFEVRLAVVEEVGALGNDLMKDEETIKVLRIRLSDPHVKVREAVAVSLRKITEKKKDPEPKKDAVPPAR